MLSSTEQVVAAGIWNRSVLGLLLFEVFFTCSWEFLQGLVFSLMPISCISLIFTISGNKFDHLTSCSDQLMQGIMMNNIATFFSLCQAIMLLPVFIMLKNYSIYKIPGFTSVCPYSVNVHTFNLEIKFDTF
jgi:hypothetical protein